MENSYLTWEEVLKTENENKNKFSPILNFTNTKISKDSKDLKDAKDTKSSIIITNSMGWDCHGTFWDTIKIK